MFLVFIVINADYAGAAGEVKGHAFLNLALVGKML
jgi:hypothetical protein